MVNPFDPSVLNNTIKNIVNMTDKLLKLVWCTRHILQQDQLTLHACNEGHSGHGPALTESADTFSVLIFGYKNLRVATVLCNNQKHHSVVSYYKNI